MTVGLPTSNLSVNFAQVAAETWMVPAGAWHAIASAVLTASPHMPNTRPIATDNAGYEHPGIEADSDFRMVSPG
jgi:hypothetical protein